MQSIQMMLKRFAKEESAPTIVEYAVMLVLVAIAVALAAPNFRDAIINVFSRMISALG